MKWFNEILTGLKSFFGLEHDATESEVHAALTKHGNLENMKQAIREELQEEVNTLQSALAETEKQKDALDNRLKEVEAENATLQATLSDLKKEAETLKADATAKADEIERMKKEPAAEHTGGETEPFEKKTARAYENNPLYKRAQEMRKQRPGQ